MPLTPQSYAAAAGAGPASTSCLMRLDAEVETFQRAGSEQNQVGRLAEHDVIDS